MHVEKLGREEVDGILAGTCDIFPKLDGCNGMIYLDDNGHITCGSRNRALSETSDNQGFRDYVWNNIDKFNKYFSIHPDVILYGEWLVPHTLKTYREDMWRRFWVFDVLSNETYIRYDAYSPELDEYEIDYVPRIAQIKNPTEDKLIQIMQENKFGIKDGEGIGKGIVIKNYNFTNRYDRVTWAKIVSTDFTDKHRHEMGEPQIEMSPVEDKIAALLTQDMVDKVYANLVAENDDLWANNLIPRFLSTVWHDFIVEELWSAIKKFKNPTVSFRMLQHHVTNRIKKLKPKAF